MFTLFFYILPAHFFVIVSSYLFQSFEYVTELYWVNTKILQRTKYSLRLTLLFVLQNVFFHSVYQSCLTFVNYYFLSSFMIQL